MTYSMIVGKYKLIFSDTHFKDFRKKPTISVYDADTNSETKIASFNSKETFEWFVKAVVEADRKTAPTISKMEQVDEPERNMAEDIVESFGFKAESYRQAKAKDEPQTCSFSDCDNFKNPDYERCIECKRKQIKLKTEQTEREGE